MSFTLERRLRFVERRGERSKDLPWLRHKVLLLELWTGAYMMDTWEGWVILGTPLVLLLAGMAYFWR